MKRFLILFALATALVAQGPPHDGGGRGDNGRGRRPGPPPGPPQAEMSGKWWMNPGIVRRLGLTTDQQKSLEDIFQQNRLRLIDLTASLEKEEAILDPLLGADHPQESVVFAQIDRVADARAALEKANSRMLYAFRMQLTPDQWRQLQDTRPQPR
jgi:periplasmic protein CpxP/Spy